MIAVIRRLFQSIKNQLLVIGGYMPGLSVSPDSGFWVAQRFSAAISPSHVTWALASEVVAFQLLTSQLFHFRHGLPPQHVQLIPASTEPFNHTRRRLREELLI